MLHAEPLSIETQNSKTPGNFLNANWATTKCSAVRISDSWKASPKRYIYVALDGSSSSNNALKWALDNVFRVEDDHLILLSVGILDLDITDVLQETFDKLFGMDDTAGRSAVQRFALQQAVTILEDAERQLLNHEIYLKINEANLIMPSYELVAVASDTVESGILDHVARKDEASLSVCMRPSVVEPAPCILVVGSRGLGPLNRLLLGSVSDHLIHYSPVPIVVVRDN
ncbi:hypothetical protein BC829DRAFT_385644 [Chytridium lagenaria]|nr:hypothetical protein BC829DRAFT_385644 [Chytridium lagenaria]